MPKKLPIGGVKQVVVVASGKGGVGKSTTAGKESKRKSVVSMVVPFVLPSVLLICLSKALIQCLCFQ